VAQQDQLVIREQQVPQVQQAHKEQLVQTVHKDLQVIRVRKESQVQLLAQVVRQVVPERQVIKEIREHPVVAVVLSQYKTKVTHYQQRLQQLTLQEQVL
jgi:hypothetical protein